ncbi:multiheme c-type cytochrome [uncultured Microbulbifer sp.]|uniref:multiheme c-type cytochrome n=1 Tax=uncultured Microbulbifer sp. TaxID=348147 RepID=UPI0025FE14BF|nr:multiheme c-type cytochrome [uncultured Microbulbifer sp.]
MKNAASPQKNTHSRRADGLAYIGAEQCASCHQQAFDQWQHSHHDLAMKEATDKTVIGNFDDAEFDYYGTVSKFFQRDGKYFAKTDGPDGKLHEYPVAYTFGVEPLQQYLIEMPGGRLQALSIAWDSRSEEAGGQRWFHLYPDEEIKPGDPLHWTGLSQNWNFMCADCHSTNFQKNYDASSKSFASTWSEINVGCEACHGPGSGHVTWANAPAEKRKDYGAGRGLEISYRDRLQGAWQMNMETGIAQLVKKDGNANIHKELQVCAQCHSRRSTAFPGAHPQSEFFDHFNLALLDEGLYHADGQIDDEVYVYGSFLQSKMHAAGVTCSNCHNPHSMELRAQDNALCAQCHLPEKFDTAEHHFHPAASEGAQCVNCHMTDKVYMQVDARRDHSFRVPRPDLSQSIGSPNACTGCHADKGDKWATQILEAKYGKPDPHYGEALHAGRTGAADAESRLLNLVMDESQPAIARATAVSLLPDYLSQTSAQVLQVVAQGDDALLHLGMAQSLDRVAEQVRPALAIPLLYENERVIAAEAANAIAATPIDRYPAPVKEMFAKGLQDYLASETFNSDRPESLVNLAGYYAQQGDTLKSESYFRKAIELEPSYSPAYVNLADLYRSADREALGEKVLQQGLEASLHKSPIQHALGLSLVRQKRMDEAMDYLRESAHAAVTSPRYIYVYAIALNSSGRPNQAIKELEQGLQRFPQDRQIVSALVSIHREQGNEKAAQKYQHQLE